MFGGGVMGFFMLVLWRGRGVIVGGFGRLGGSLFRGGWEEGVRTLFRSGEEGKRWF